MGGFLGISRGVQAVSFSAADGGVPLAVEFLVIVEVWVQVILESRTHHGRLLQWILHVLVGRGRKTLLLVFQGLGRIGLGKRVWQVERLAIGRRVLLVREGRPGKFARHAIGVEGVLGQVIFRIRRRPRRLPLAHWGLVLSEIEFAGDPGLDLPRWDETLGLGSLGKRKMSANARSSSDQLEPVDWKFTNITKCTF